MKEMSRTLGSWIITELLHDLGEKNEKNIKNHLVPTPLKLLTVNFLGVIRYQPIQDFSGGT